MPRVVFQNWCPQFHELKGFWNLRQVRNILNGVYIHCLRNRYFKIGITCHCSQPIRVRKFFRLWSKLNGHLSVEYWQEIYWANRGCSNYSTYLRPQQTSTRFPLFFYRRYSSKSGIPWLCLLGAETSRKRTYIIQLFPEGEVNSGRYIPRREASRYISTALHPPQGG